MRTSIEQQLRADAASDPAFRSALLSDPLAAVGERYGVAVPDGLTLRVIEESADEVVLVLPSAATRLSDEALDASLVVGGQPNSLGAY